VAARPLAPKQNSPMQPSQGREALQLFTLTLVVSYMVCGARAAPGLRNGSTTRCSAAACSAPGCARTCAKHVRMPLTVHVPHVRSRAGGPPRGRLPGGPMMGGGLQGGGYGSGGMVPVGPGMGASMRGPPPPPIGSLYDGEGHAHNAWCVLRRRAMQRAAPGCGCQGGRHARRWGGHAG